MNCSTINNVKKVIHIFYSRRDHWSQKKSLWDFASSILGNYPDRKSPDTRYISTAHLKENFDTLKKLDAVEKIPEVAACNLNRLPEELNLLRIVQRVAELEKVRTSMPMFYQRCQWMFSRYRNTIVLMAKQWLVIRWPPICHQIDKMSLA